MTSFDAKRILITGVSSGLGHGLAKNFLASGASVYGCSRREPTDLVEAGLQFASLDLADESGSRPVLKTFIADVKQFDLVILNAGKLGEIRDMTDTPLADLRETMEINVWANKWLLDSLFTSGREVKQVVAISSGASVSGSRGWNGYSLSKTALNMLVKLYAGEHPKTHFTSLAPGLVDTAMQDYLCEEVDTGQFPSVEKLKNARGTAGMPKPQAAAGTILGVLERLRAGDSGQFVDMRTLDD